jgi:hypothetical protein
MVFVASLCFSVIVSRQRQQIERLIEETAVISAELRDLRAAHAATSGAVPESRYSERPAASGPGPKRPRA